MRRDGLSYTYINIRQTVIFLSEVTRFPLVTGRVRGQNLRIGDKRGRLFYQIALYRSFFGREVYSYFI